MTGTNTDGDTFNRVQSYMHNTHVDSIIAVIDNNKVIAVQTFIHDKRTESVVIEYMDTKNKTEQHFIEFVGCVGNQGFEVKAYAQIPLTNFMQMIFQRIVNKG